MSAAAPQPFAVPGPRIAVVGVTGSGKTTTAARLAAVMAVPHIELDALHWLPGWKQRELEPFRALVAQAVAAPAWVTDGNYKKVRDLIWERAATLVWLDYPLPVILRQLTQRTLKRMRQQELLWGTNRENWRDAFFSRESLFLWALQSYPKFRKEYPDLFHDPRYAHLQVIRFTRPRQTTQWLDWLARQDILPRSG